MPLVRRIAMRTIRTLPSSSRSTTSCRRAGRHGRGCCSVAPRNAKRRHFEAYASVTRARRDPRLPARARSAVAQVLGASRRLTDAASSLTQRLGRTPNEDEMAAELGLRCRLSRAAHRDFSERRLRALELSAAADLPITTNPARAANVARELVARCQRHRRLTERMRMCCGLHYQGVQLRGSAMCSA